MNQKRIQQENGFVLVTTMMLLVVLSLIALTGIRSSRVELLIAGNTKWHQNSFYRAEGALDASTLLLEMQLEKADVYKKSSKWDKAAFYINDKDFDLWEIAGKNSQNGKLRNPNNPASTRKISDDFKKPGEPLANRGNIIVLPKNALEESTKTIKKGQPVSLVRLGLVASDATPGMDVGIADAQTQAVGTTRSEYTIWARNYGKMGSESEIEVKWYLLH